MSTKLIDDLLFLTLDDRKVARQKIAVECKRLSGDPLGRGLVVFGRLLAAMGRIKQATGKVEEAAPLIKSEVGAAELTGLRLSILRDTGELKLALVLAREAFTVCYVDQEAWWLTHFNLALVEGASGNTDRALLSWREAARSSRPIYSVGASVNMARDYIDQQRLAEARESLERADHYRAPRMLAAIRYHNWSRWFAAHGDLGEAVRHQELALAEIQDLEPLRVARHIVALIELLIRTGEVEKADQALTFAHRLAFDLEEERQEVAATALYGLTKAAAANQLSKAALAAARNSLAAEPNRWGRSNQGHG